MAEMKFEISKNLGTLSETKSGWKKEVNIVAWNDGKPKLDIRQWSPDHKKMSKGITLDDDEVQNLRDILEEV